MADQNGSNQNSVAVADIADKVDSKSGNSWSEKNEAEATGQASSTVSATWHAARDDAQNSGDLPERMFAKEDSQDGGNGSGIFSFLTDLLK